MGEDRAADHCSKVVVAKASGGGVVKGGSVAAGVEAMVRSKESGGRGRMGVKSAVVVARVESGVEEVVPPNSATPSKSTHPEVDKEMGEVMGSTGMPGGGFSVRIPP